jgi:hypothetical protein
MERRDYLKKQIDELGRALGKLLEKLAGKRAIEVIGDKLMEQNLAGREDFSLRQIVDRYKQGELNQLIKEKEISSDHLNQLAEIFSTLADSFEKDENEKAFLYYQIALDFYQLLNNNQSVYSLDVDFRIQKIKRILGDF